jgi:YegS/Rv2252/BmrU family lipid kinase
MKCLLAERGIDSAVTATEHPNHATELAREAVDDGVDMVISYGGDGTLNEVLQGMVGGNAALALWPGGTGNVVAHDLKMPFKLRPLADALARGKTKRIAIGVAKGEGVTIGEEGSHPSTRGRYFLMFAGIGLDASIVRGVNPILKRLMGQFAFWVSGIEHLFTWRPQPFFIEVDGKRFEATFALIGKGKGYGGGICMTPHARLEDPWFEVYVVPRLRNNISYIKSLAISTIGDRRMAAGTLVTGRFVTANSTVDPWVEVDGEVIGPLPMTFEVVPDALSIIVP